MIESKLIDDGLKRGKAERIKGEPEYVRFRSSFKGIERGTVIIGDKIVGKGDMVGKRRVKAIMRNSVILEEDGKEYILRLK